MSLYHEAAEALSAPSSSGGSFKSRVFGNKNLKSPPAQIFALAVETCKWSAVLKEVVEAADLLRHERKLTPVLALLLVHDFLLSKGGIALPQSHGLRAAVERHKARLTSEMTRARIRRKKPDIDSLRAQINLDADPEGRHPRWVRINAVKTDVDAQLGTTFKAFSRALSIDALVAADPGSRTIYIDEHVPNLVAVTPGLDLTKTEAYKAGSIILQDKASCFPAYLLDPHPEHGDVIDSCAAPGNKTTHLAAVLASREPEVPAARKPTIFAFERDDRRALTLEKMVKTAGSKSTTRIGFGQDFLAVDPASPTYSKVAGLLLDPSCSGSGIVGRDSMPELHLPAPAGGGKSAAAKQMPPPSRKRKHGSVAEEAPVLVDDDGNTTAVTEQDLRKRLAALAGFQLTLVEHAMKFPAARRITYSTCSVHGEENEHVVIKALASDVARRRGWRVLPRERQVRGMRDWPVRGVKDACSGAKDAAEAEAVAEACIRAYKGDGRGVMGFFVAAFERDGTVDDGGAEAVPQDEDGPYVRDEDGVIVRDVMGMPSLKATGETVSLEAEHDEEDESSTSKDEDEESSDSEDSEGGEEDEWKGFD